MPDLLQVAVETPFKDLVTYVAGAAAVGAFAFVWRVNTVLTELRTLISHPETGLIAKLEKMSGRSHDVNNDLNEHGSRLDVVDVRLDAHDKNFDEINEERRHTVRRKEDRE